MPYLKHRDLKALHRIGQTILECDQVIEVQNRTVELAGPWFNAEIIGFFLARNSEQRVDLNQVPGNIQEKYLKLYEEYYYQLDFVPKHVENLSGPVQTLTYEEIISYQDLLKTEYYNEFLKPQSLHHCLNIFLNSSNVFLGGIGFFRSHMEPPFSAQDKTKAELLVPFLIAALEKSLFTERIIRARRALEACTKLFPGKKNIVLDEYMKPIFGNEEALEIFSNRPESLEIDCPPSIFLPEKLHEFCQKLKKSAPLEKDRISFQEFNVRTDDGREIAGHLGLLSEPQQPPMYLVCLDLPLITLSKELRRFGLSKRELEVANLVCQGFKNSQIADHLFISESTVEKHLYSIYNKCGVNNRTSLVYLLILQDRLFALDSLSPL